MNHATTASAAIAPRHQAWLRNTGLAISGSLLVAAAAHVSVPLFFTPVPFTLQTLAVLALGMLLGPTVAFSAMALYLLEGASGLPVFSPAGPGGIVQLLGPDGGYLMAYPLAAAASGWLYRRVRQSNIFSNFGAAIASAFIGDVLIFACGAAWLASITHFTLTQLATVAVLPFLPGDALKIVAAAAMVTGFARYRKSRTVEQ